jgi:hypothetical protein
MVSPAEGWVVGNGGVVIHTIDGVARGMGSGVRSIRQSREPIRA